jgi:uncharacterized membrane protein
MTGVSARPVVAGRLLAPTRLLGVDTARGLALLGMMAVHVVPSVDAEGSVTLAYRISAGRASALFAVLAGLSLVLSTGRRGEPGALAAGARRGVLARAAFIAAIGMTLGVLSSGVAVILVHYGVLFAIGAALLGLRLRPLLAMAAGWLLISPVVAHLVRGHLPPGPGFSPSWFSLGNPLELGTTLLFTGYYPVLQWMSYLLVGMAVGRLPLRRSGTAAWLLVTGAALAVGAKLLSGLLLALAGGVGRLTVPPSSVLAGSDLETVLRTGTYGTTPTTTPWWLAVSGPHSGTPLDLVHTTGTSLAVIGGCLLLAGALRGRWRGVVLPVAAAGSMTLTLYSVHVVALAATGGAGSGAGTLSAPQTWLLHVVVAVGSATLWQLTGQRGPLEGVAADITSAARSSGARPDAAGRLG